MRIKILKAIEHEARVDVSELAVRLGMDQTAILNEMNEMKFINERVRVL